MSDNWGGVAISYCYYPKTVEHLLVLLAFCLFLSIPRSVKGIVSTFS